MASHEGGNNGSAIPDNASAATAATAPITARPFERVTHHGSKASAAVSNTAGDAIPPPPAIAAAIAVVAATRRTNSAACLLPVAATAAAPIQQSAKTAQVAAIRTGPETREASAGSNAGAITNGAASRMPTNLRRRPRSSPSPMRDVTRRSHPASIPAGQDPYRATEILN